MSEFSLNEKCPCGSRRKYENCCHKRGIQWKLNEKGQPTQIIPLSKELVEEFKSLQEKFKRTFERDYEADDKVFSSLEYLYPGEDLKNLTIKMLFQADVHPEHIYAYIKTDIIITKENHHRAPLSKLKKWNKAVLEYREKKKYGDPLDEVLTKRAPKLLVNAYESLLSEEEACRICIAMALHSIEAIKDEKQFYQMFCLTKTFRTIDSIFLLIHNNISDDVLSLIRTVYENYLHIIYLSKHPDKFDDLFVAPIGIEAGHFEYEKNNTGKVNHRIIIDKKTGKKFKGHISTRLMAEASDFPEDVELYDIFYSHLSVFIHPVSKTIFDYFDFKDYSFMNYKQSNTTAPLLFTMFISVITLQEILKNIEQIPSKEQKDISTVMKRIRNKILYLGKKLDDGTYPTKLKSVIEKRIKLSFQ